jgi:hypothetical protein
MKENWHQVTSVGVIVLVSLIYPRHSYHATVPIAFVAQKLLLTFPFPPISGSFPSYLVSSYLILILDSLPAQRELIELPTKLRPQNLPTEVLASEETFQEISAPCPLSMYPKSPTFL